MQCRSSICILKAVYFLNIAQNKASLFLFNGYIGHPQLSFTLEVDFGFVFTLYLECETTSQFQIVKPSVVIKC